jgi:hypothetical protein
MGFNATRRYRDGRWVDIALLIGGMVLIGGLVAWGFGLF